MHSSGYEIPDKIVCEEGSDYMLVDSELVDVPFLPPGKTKFDNPRQGIDDRSSVEWHLKVLEQENVATTPIKTVELQEFMKTPTEELLGWYMIKDPLFDSEPEGVITEIRFDWEDTIGETMRSMMSSNPQIEIQIV